MQEKRRRWQDTSVIPFCSEFDLGREFRITGAVTVRKIAVGCGRRMMQCGYLRIGDGSSLQELTDEEDEPDGSDGEENCEMSPEDFYGRDMGGGPPAGKVGVMESDRKDEGA
jgi:hypothetical protein